MRLNNINRNIKELLFIWVKVNQTFIKFFFIFFWLIEIQNWYRDKLIYYYFKILFILLFIIIIRNNCQKKKIVEWTQAFKLRWINYVRDCRCVSPPGSEIITWIQGELLHHGWNRSVLRSNFHHGTTSLLFIVCLGLFALTLRLRLSFSRRLCVYVRVYVLSCRWIN